ncbi:17568_t:CDS:2 [Racocetra fulgida]|uniref:17568_t:CDS:1 n=1 Tax=Racocetra fulgida TaxID=60492 RepID=A0A9N8ZWL7_9GLOM|nr:17568_t:CDS:2 [Racocetra fulgida]
MESKSSLASELPLDLTGNGARLPFPSSGAILSTIVALEIPGFVLKRSSRYRRSTFPYAAMLKRLDYDRFCGSVDLWCSCTDQELYNARVLLMRALLRLFLTRSVILLHLVLGEWFEKTTTDLKYRRIIEDEFQILLEPVRKLRIKGNFVKDRILNGLSEPCKNLSLRSINLLDVTFTDNIPWSDLFECKNLEKIKFRDCIGFENGELLTKDDCHMLVEWGLDQGALVTVGNWDCVDGWVKFGQTVHGM